MYWNFIPPGGQFQNDDHVKGWLVLGVGVASMATWATTLALYDSWRLPPLEENRSSASLRFMPRGDGLGFTF